MTKYKFGVMSMKWSLEADDELVAYLTMAMFMNQNVPVAVFSPKESVFMPLEILEKNKGNLSKELSAKMEKCMQTIKEAKL